MSNPSLQFFWWEHPDNIIYDEDSRQNIKCAHFNICGEHAKTKEKVVFHFYISQSGIIWFDENIQDSSKNHSSRLVRIYSYTTDSGYNRVELPIKIYPWKYKSFRVDELVLNAFKGNNEGKKRIKHLNKYKDDDSLSNLVWI